MHSSINRQIVESLWRAFDRFEFEAVAPLLHDDFVLEWPQSGERIRGRDNFIAINKNYPGQWRISIQRLVASGDEVVTEITATYGDQVARAISFFELQDGKIIRVREFWPDPFDARRGARSGWNICNLNRNFRCLANVIYP